MMQSLFKAFSDNVFNFTHMAMNLWGTQAAFEDKLQLTDVFTEGESKNHRRRGVEEMYARRCGYSQLRLWHWISFPHEAESQQCDGMGDRNVGR